MWKLLAHIFVHRRAIGNTRAVEAATAQRRVKRGDAVMATMPIDVTSNQTVSLDNIPLPAHLGDTIPSREKDYKFKWDVSVNGGAWKSAGESGDHNRKDERKGAKQ